MSTARTSTLFHFTKSLDTLKLILNNGFWPKYCLEDHEWMAQEIFHVAYPMVCFCDIPISRLEEHTDCYGEYGIGLSHEWGKKNGLNPVIYLTENGMPKTSLRNLIASKLIKPESDESRALIDLVKFTKPNIGTTIVKGKSEIMDYYEECEWRYVPDNITLEDVGALSKEQFENAATKDVANQKTKACSDLHQRTLDIYWCHNHQIFLHSTIISILS